MTHRFQFRFFLAGALLLAMGAAIPAWGQDPAPEDFSRGVARISLMDGEVSVRRGDSGEWVAGVLNAPLMTDDRIATGQNSRAEVQFDAANLLRMGGNAEIHLALLENGKYRIEIARGTLTFRKLSQQNAETELNTPSVSVRPTMPGTVRLNVTEANESEITSRVGDVEVFTPQGTQWIYAGQTMMARGSASDPEFQMEDAIPQDDWDRWNEGRDRAMGSDNSAQYVPPGVDGTAELDAAGTWIDVAPYGYVWRPVGMAAGWAPYRNGRWVWLNWYGWTWVSYDPWGWAPYHYGRWFFDTRWGWAWYPGALGVRAYWSPALVGFFGYGHGGVGVGFGFANVGWVPLAPFETFHRWWGPGYAGGFNRNLNLTNVSVTAVYRNARISNGVSGIAAADFAAGRFNGVQRVGGAQMQTASLVQGRLALNPGVANRRFSDRMVANVPRPAANTHFYSGGAGGGVNRPMRGSQAPAGYHRFGEPGRAAQNARTPQQAAAGNPGQRPGVLRRFGEPGAGQNAPRNERPSATRGGGGWRSFGQPGLSRGGRQPYNPPPNRPGVGAAPRSAPPRGGGGGGHAAPRGGGGRR